MLITSGTVVDIYYRVKPQSDPLRIGSSAYLLRAVPSGDVDRDPASFGFQVSTVLRDLMRERGITQQDVADVLGRSQGYVSQRTNGREVLGLDIIQAVAHLAHLTPRALMVELTERTARVAESGTESSSSPDAPAPTPR